MTAARSAGAHQDHYTCTQWQRHSVEALRYPEPSTTNIDKTKNTEPPCKLYKNDGTPLYLGSGCSLVTALAVKLVDPQFLRW
jgi:hypothetical protein